MKRLLAVLFGSLVAAGVQAAPKAESAAECGIAADMAVVARSLAEELFMTCIKSGGNMDTVLGKRL